MEEVIEISDDNLQDWTRNKLRGFKRTGTATYAEKVKEPQTTQTNTKQQVTVTNPVTVGTDSSQGGNGDKKKRILYCHYFSNHGTCSYEEKTGEK